MNCGCQLCGALSLHVEKGEDSYCACPRCDWTCRDCMGGDNIRFHPLSREAIKKMKDEKI